ncbi:hypothetical protein ES703_37824 [subsurface metagenome]
MCDGTADQVEINNALNALPVGGGAVYLAEGTYAITASINLASNVALVGQGAGTVLRVPNDHDANLNMVSGNGIDHALVANLKIDGNKANQAAGNMDGIYFDTVTHSKVVDCWVDDMYAGIGIYLLDSSEYNTITGNTCQGNTRYGIELSSSNYNTVVGNTCQGNDEGISLSGSDYNTVTGNTCQGNAYGLDLGTSDYNTFVGNTTEGNDYMGIYVNTSSYNTITGNTVKGNGEHGIEMYNANNHNTIEGNTIEGNSQDSDDTYDGIFVDANSDYNNIQGNTVRQGVGANTQRYGIRINAATCDGNFVANNDLHDAGTTNNFSDAGTGTIFDYSQNGTETNLVPIDSTGLKENTITFPVSFHTAPRVIANLTNFDNDESIAYVVQIKTVTTNNFTIICNVVTASATAGHNADIYWYATVAPQSGGRE